jgi:hypothetical protein
MHHSAARENVAAVSIWGFAAVAVVSRAFAGHAQWAALWSTSHPVDASGATLRHRVQRRVFVDVDGRRCGGLDERAVVAVGALAHHDSLLSGCGGCFLDYVPPVVPCGGRRGEKVEGGRGADGAQQVSDLPPVRHAGPVAGRASTDQLSFAATPVSRQR